MKIGGNEKMKLDNETRLKMEITAIPLRITRGFDKNEIRLDTPGQSISKLSNTELNDFVKKRIEVRELEEK